MAEDFKAFIDKVRNAADIVEVVESYNISLKRSGVNLKACCPFHNEKTPSFFVSPDRQSFKCYGCGEGGDVIKFVQKIDTLEFKDALEALARRYNVPVPQFRGAPTPDEAKRREAQYNAMEMAARYYAKYLFEPPHGRAAIEYLQKRGASKETVDTFRLGLAPDTWSGLMDEARRQGYHDDTLVAAGLIQERTSGGGYRDRFVGRLMFPICDAQGRVVAFGGRTVAKDEEPKYLNSPETPLYRKSQTLYAFHLARKAIAQRREAILVEGYFDAIALHQFGFTNAVASCGTALTDDQARLIRRLCDTVMFLYDADEAGQKAMARGCEILMAHDFTIRVATLTEGDDPDTFLQKHGAKGFEEYLRNHARDFFTFLVEFVRAQHDDGSTRGRIRAVEALAPMVSKVPNVIARNDYARRAAAQLGLNESDVFAFLSQAAAQKPQQRQAPLASTVSSERLRRSVEQQKADPYEAWERHALWFVLHSVAARQVAAAKFQAEHFFNEDIRRLMERAIEAGDRPFASLAEMEELAETDEQRARLADVAIAAREREAGANYEELDAEKTIREVMSRLHRFYLKRCADERRAELSKAQESNDQSAQNELRDEIHDYSKHRVNLFDKEYKPLFPAANGGNGEK